MPNATHGAERIAIVDLDVHHGNGTQDIFWSDPSVLYASSHQWPLFPGTGAVSETGEQGNIVNLPLPGGTGSQGFRAGFEGVILPRVDGFEADLIVISAGFDAHRRDPLASLDLGEDDFGWATRKLMAIAGSALRRTDRLGARRWLRSRGSPSSVSAHVEALMEA